MRPIDFTLLGSLEVMCGGAQLKLGGRKQRVLLAMLMCNANELVPTDLLIDALWGTTLPRTAEQNLRVYIYHLRRILGSDQRIAWRAPGYMLTVLPGELDIDRFGELTTAGNDALARHALADGSELLDRALRLWRGPALAGLLDVEPLRARAVHLEERRLDALEKRITADIALGRHANLVAELRVLAEEYPLREHLQAQFMMALYRSGRRAEALDAFRAVRRTLVDELGVEPGTELQRLHQGILCDDAAACDALFPAAPGTVPRQVAASELGEIRSALDRIGRLLDRIEDTPPRDDR